MSREAKGVMMVVVRRMGRRSSRLGVVVIVVFFSVFLVPLSTSYSCKGNLVDEI